MKEHRSKMTLPFGIDISKHQGTNDYAKMRANTSFVFVKATESWGYTDPKFYANWTGLIGHNRGAYSYVWLSDDPLRQANHLIDIVTQAGVDWKYDRLVLDLEKSGHGLSRAEVSRRVLVMMERIKEVTGRYPILYSRKYWVQDNMLLTDPRLINADWHLAYYRTALPYPLYTPEMPPPPLMPNGVSKWLFHQTCERGKGREVGVGSYYVDQNRFNGTRAELDAYFGRGTNNVYLPIITNPEPEPVEDDWTGLLKVKLWSQHDPRWGNDRMGSTYILMKQQGCLVTDVAIYLDYLGIDTDPKRYNLLLSSQGGYESYKKDGKIIHTNNMYWKYPGVLYPDKIQRELSDYTWYWNGMGWETQARSILKSKRPVLALVDMYAGGALNQHWVLIVGERADGWWAVDPETGTLINLSKYENKVYRIVSYGRRN
jgi:GH25 family lysozyme M1 (1,4-beta-N-acetylmuramidase)